MKKKKRNTAEKGEGPRKKAKASVAPTENGPTGAAAGLPPGAGLSTARNCRHLPEAGQVPAVSVSRGLPSPASFTGRVTLARLFGTEVADWPRGFKKTPFRPGRPREVGLVSALAWLVSSPVLGAPRLVHGIAQSVWDAASREERDLAEELLALRMRLETGEITDAEFQRGKKRIEAAAEQLAAKGREQV